MLLRVRLSADTEPAAQESTIWFALTVDRSGRIAEMQDYSSQATAERDLALRARGRAAAGAASRALPVSGLVPFVRVADVGARWTFTGCSAWSCAKRTNTRAGSYGR